MTALLRVKEHITYAEMQERVARFAGVLKANGVGYGDRVIIYMPMIPEAVVAMLATVRIGAIHSVVFGGFAASELAKRIDDCTPKMIVSASCGIEPSRIVEYKPMLDEAIEISQHKPETCIMLQRSQAEATMIAGRDIDWHASHEGVEPADCVRCAAKTRVIFSILPARQASPKGWSGRQGRILLRSNGR